MTLILSGTNGVTFPDSTDQATGYANGVGFRNRIINGDMRIDQRNAGAAVTVNASTDFFPIDRFVGYGTATDGVFTLQQSTTAPAGFVNSIVATVTTADASVGTSEYYFLSQRIEGTNVADLGFGTANAKTVTLSFWVRSSLTGTFGGCLGNGGFNRSYPFLYTISVANTWEYKTVTIPGDTTGTWLTTTGIGMRVYWDFGSGSNNVNTADAWVGAGEVGATGGVKLISTLNATWYVTGVQLEVGSVATPFERRPYGTELALCQRYFVKFGGNVTDEAIGTFGTGASATTSRIYVPLPVSMRAAPSVSSSTLELIDSVNPAIAVSSVAVGSTVTGPLNGFIVATVASGLTTFRPYALRVANSLSGHLSYSAEL
jgi:hypothetical protein